MWLFGFFYYCVNYFQVYSLPKTDHFINHLFLFRVTSWREKGWRDNRGIQLAIFFTSTYRVKWLKSKLAQTVKINIDENNLKIPNTDKTRLFEISFVPKFAVWNLLLPKFAIWNLIFFTEIRLFEMYFLRQLDFLAFFCSDIFV